MQKYYFHVLCNKEKEIFLKVLGKNSKYYIHCDSISFSLRKKLNTKKILLSNIYKNIFSNKNITHQNQNKKNN